jgi:hypothetical protein
MTSAFIPDTSVTDALAGYGINLGGGQPAPSGGMSSLLPSGFLSSTDKNGVTTQGWGTPAIGALQGLASLYMGMKQYGLAKDTLNQNKLQFGLNYDAQRQSVNSQLEDRQRARVASNAGAYQSVGDYMKQYAIAPRP